MFGMIPFVGLAGRKLGAMIKGRKGKETLEKEVKDLGLDTTGVDIEVDDDGGVSLIGDFKNILRHMAALPRNFRSQ